MHYLPALSPHPAGTAIRLRLTPRAATTALGGLQGDAIKLRVAAPPVEGKANEAVLAHLAKALGVRVSALQLVSGHRSRTKVVVAAGLSPPEVARRLGD
jgi:uncharacterized protein